MLLYRREVKSFTM